MKFIVGLLLVLLMAGCRPKDNQKAISVFINPASLYNDVNEHVEIYLNKTKVAEKTVAGSKISSDVFVGCFNVDSLEKNEVVIKIKQQGISNRSR